MESRNDLAPTLTVEQRILINHFNDIIARNDSTQIIEAVEQLQSIPEEFSPIRTLALKDDLAAIKQCIALVKEAVNLHAEKYLAEKMQQQAGAFATALRQSVMGNTSALLETMDLNLLKVAATNIYLRIATPIYRHALWAFASKGMTEKVNELISDYKKTTDEKDKSYSDALESYSHVIPNYEHYRSLYSRDQFHIHYFDSKVVKKRLDGYMQSISERMKLVNIENVESIYNDIAKGYLEGEHYSEAMSLQGLNLKTRSHIVKKLIEKKKFAEMIEFVKKNYDNNLLIVAFEACNPEQIVLLCDQFPAIPESVKFVASIGNVEGVTQLWRGRPASVEKRKQFVDEASKGYKLGGFVLESKKIQALHHVFPELYPNEYDPNRPAKLFELIKSISLEDIDVKISLLVDCLYKETLLGDIFWRDYYTHSDFSGSSKNPTPTLKRGVLNQVLSELVKMHVDIAKLPGCGTYSAGLFTKYPSKKDLLNKFPPRGIPMLDVVIKKAEVRLGAGDMFSI